MATRKLSDCKWPTTKESAGFFFSSRRRHTRCSRDWSSDVCSSDLLEHPGNHRPLARQMDPLLPWVARQQRSESKRKRNRKTRITGIQIRRMNDHLRVLQQRIQSVAVGSRDEAHHATCPGRSQSLERALHEIVQRKKEDRKSTRLNSSHGYISYAVFCLKKKKSKYNIALEACGIHITD